MISAEARNPVNRSFIPTEAERQSQRSVGKIPHPAAVEHPGWAL
jgi:hypothetical protein